MPCIYIYIFFSCQIFPRRERNFTSEAICSWVYENHETVLKWLQPPGTKSRLLEQELTKGPALLLFLPHNPLGSNPNPILQQVSRDGINHIEGEQKLDLFHLFLCHLFLALDLSDACILLNFPIVVRYL